MKKLFLPVILLMCTLLLSAQGMQEKDMRGYTPPDELITMSANIPFEQAVLLISKLSEKKNGKRVVSQVNRENSIGVEIANVQYMKALIMIVQYAGLDMETREDVIVIKKKNEVKVDLKPETYAAVNSREVRISAVFFDMDINGLKDRGINWQLALSGRSFGAGVKNTTTSQASGTTSSSELNLSTSSQFGLGGLFGEAISFFKFLESENLGEIIASPNITVRDRTLGNIQVGSDFSIKTRDFSGNVLDRFFSTGSIVKVTPYLYTEDSLEYCLIDLEVERSSGFPGELSTEIKKTSAKTQVLMLNGEQTVIGGLYLNEEQKQRVGIPILKDLPWYVLGLRYLTGSDKVTVIKKELVILIKVEIIPSLKERALMAPVDNPIKNELKRYKDDLKFYQFNKDPGPQEQPKKEN